MMLRKESWILGVSKACKPATIKSARSDEAVDEFVVDEDDDDD